MTLRIVGPGVTCTNVGLLVFDYAGQPGFGTSVSGVQEAFHDKRGLSGGGNLNALGLEGLERGGRQALVLLAQVRQQARQPLRCLGRQRRLERVVPAQFIRTLESAPKRSLVHTPGRLPQAAGDIDTTKFDYLFDNIVTALWVITY